MGEQKGSVGRKREGERAEGEGERGGGIIGGEGEGS